MRAHFLINSVKCLVQKSVSNRTVFCAVANYQPYFKNFSTNHIAMVQAKKFIYAKRYEGEPKVTDFKFVEEDLPPLKDGEILVEAEYLSVDPYMRPYMARYPVGCDMIGGQVARVVESKEANYPVGTYVFGMLGWRTHTIVNPNELKEKAEFTSQMYQLPNFGKLPLSYAIGCLGMPGNTAYFGFLEICQPKSGETVVVSGAAGAVGSLVGQIAKIKGCKVIGFAGSDEKCEWLKTIGFDYAFNYKSKDLKKALKTAAPKGIDCYFDNVGGELSSIVINQMNLFGRISVCGSISSYNTEPDQYPKVPILQPNFVFNQLRMEGFIVSRWSNRWIEGILQMKQWVESGQIKPEETITEGFENMPKAFIEMLCGKNTGKAIVKVLNSSSPSHSIPLPPIYVHCKYIIRSNK